MNQAKPVFQHNRRRFFGLLAALGAMLPWSSVRSGSRSRLARREASFYRKGR